MLPRPLHRAGLALLAAALLAGCTTRGVDHARSGASRDSADPVTTASWEPRDGRYIVFMRGSRGNEAFQLYRLDPETRAETLLTDPDQRHPLLGWVKSLAVVTSVPLDRTATEGRRSAITTTVSLIDPPVPWTESEQIVRQLQARGMPVWYLLADNEGHGFARRENADFHFAALVTFIERTLLR